MTDLVPVGPRPVEPWQNADDDWTVIRDGWLLTFESVHTRRSYARDFACWCDYLAGLPTVPAVRTVGWDRPGVPVLEATWRHAVGYLRVMEHSPTAQTGRPLKPASRARRRASAASFYRHACRTGVLDANPFEHAQPPRVDLYHTETVGLTLDEAQRLIEAARLIADQAELDRVKKPAQRDAAMIALMLCTGARISEVTSAQVEDLSYDRGHRVLHVTRKGGRRQGLVLGQAARVVDEYVAAHGLVSGPLFPTLHGRPVRRQWLFARIRQVAAVAALPFAARLSNHTLRHTFTTLALDQGAGLNDVQAALGHASPAMTQKYDRARMRVDQSPSIGLSAALLGKD